jgi:hypothetical protein
VVDRRGGGGGGHWQAAQAARNRLDVGTLVERWWEASARAGIVHANYATHHRLKGNELPEEKGFCPIMPWHT